VAAQLAAFQEGLSSVSEYICTKMGLHTVLESFAHTKNVHVMHAWASCTRTFTPVLHAGLMVSYRVISSVQSAG
jgi:hypothetical protein